MIFHKDVTQSVPVRGTVPTGTLKQEFNYSHIVVYSILKRIARGNKRIFADNLQIFCKFL
jgi:hypothetical protein